MWETEYFHKPESRMSETYVTDNNDRSSGIRKDKKYIVEN